MHTRVLLCFLGALVFAAFAFVSITRDEAHSIARGARDFNELTKRFETLAREKGAVYAFAILSRADVPPGTDLHLVGHAIGEVLYEQKGVEGIADCTQDFRNACSHSVVIGALTEYGGEAALPLITDACEKAPGGPGAYTMCFHGLGHGVFAFFGYDLASTVEFCKKTGTLEYGEREYAECVSGAIMELMGGGGHDREAWSAARERYLDPEDPLAPCDRSVIPLFAKSNCYSYLTPHLWESAGIDLGIPDAQLFWKAFSYCEKLPRGSASREACYGGFGKEFLPLAAGRDIRDSTRYSDEQLRTALHWCGYAGAEEDESDCIEGALASAFWGGEKDPATAFRLCAAGDGYRARACYERLAEHIMIFTRGEDRAALCVRLPEEFLPLCK